MINKRTERFLVFFVGCPLIGLMVTALPWRNHLVLNILVILFSALGALEFQNILRVKNLVISPLEALILGAMSPVAMTLIVSFGVNDQAFPATFILGASWLLVSRVFYPLEKLADCASRSAAGFSVMIYPGLFLAWIIRMSLKDYSDILILTFMFIVFVNDAAAWAAGILFGKGNQGVFPASPNKSIAGYVGGLIGSCIIGFGAGFFFPQAFESSRVPSILGTTILAFISGIAASLGDLGESVFKRSSGIKDSGMIIPGRGGVLDTVDSIALAAPVYYVVYMFFF